MQNLVNAISSYATKRVFKKRSILLYQGEAPRMAYVIQSGLVKMYSINNAGEEQVVAFYGPNDFFPAPWIFNKTPSSLYYYETIANCEMMTLPRETLRDIIHRPEFLAQTLDYFVSSHTGLLMRITALEQSRAREKIMFTLYYLLFRYGQLTKPGLYIINFPLTHKVIASLIGLTRETTSSEIIKLKKQKVLQYRGQTYVVDKQKLEHILGEDSFKDFTL